MPSKKLIDEESRDEDKHWKKFLEDYKKKNPQKVNKAAVSLLQKDGISLQDQIHLRTKFAVEYEITKRMNDYQMRTNMNDRLRRMEPDEDMDYDEIEKMKLKIAKIGKRTATN